MLGSFNTNTNTNTNTGANTNTNTNTGANTNTNTNTGSNTNTNTGANTNTNTNTGAGANGFNRSFYATPIELGFRQWALDFLFDEAGNPQFPSFAFSWPKSGQPHWRYDDWDPALRFWALPFDPMLADWRVAHGSVDTPAVVVGREFAMQHEQWLHLDGTGKKLVDKKWLSEKVLQWNAKFSNPKIAKETTRLELSIMAEMMQDDRSQYLGEALGQADGIADYFASFLGLNGDQNPWTKELIQCGVAIGNVCYSAYKADFQRVRPTHHAPGLIAPFGPPRTPAFPSGHSFVAQTISLLLLEIDGVTERFGDKPEYGTPITKKGDASDPAQFAQHPLLWLSNRIGRNRERMGLHYPSDTDGGRMLAWGIRNMLFDSGNASGQSVLPSLAYVLKKARGEWHS